MSLRINTNVAALNAYNNLSRQPGQAGERVQQLSSGLRINKAADDAAGLSISQGLTSQINGLTQAMSQRPGRHQRRPDRRRRPGHRADDPAAHAHPGRPGRQRRHAGLELAQRDPGRDHDAEHPAGQHLHADQVRRHQAARRQLHRARSRSVRTAARPIALIRCRADQRPDVAPRWAPAASTHHLDGARGRRPRSDRPRSTRDLGRVDRSVEHRCHAEPARATP